MSQTLKEGSIKSRVFIFNCFYNFGFSMSKIVHFQDVTVYRFVNIEKKPCFGLPIACLNLEAEANAIYFVIVVKGSSKLLYNELYSGIDFSLTKHVGCKI